MVFTKTSIAAAKRVYKSEMLGHHKTTQRDILSILGYAITHKNLMMY